ncbi:MAG TPA: lysophospholipid acyltransferase family protein [Kiritimatiellia bacterium]|nr:lysophospholipid acyltransferase family protein [Kiritimatiellia bacterium]
MTEPQPSYSAWVYKTSRVLLLCWLRWKFKLKVSGENNVPEQGGVIIASNHASYLDPPLLACPLKHRVVRFMARDTLFINPMARWYFFRTGVVPLSRDRGDVGAIKSAIQLLKQGQCVGLFPEGTRTLDGNLQSAKGGIGFLIAKAEVPVVPVYISGSFEAYPKGSKKMKSHPITVQYGPAIQPDELDIKNERGKTDFDAIGRLIMDRIELLKNTPFPT